MEYKRLIMKKSEDTSEIDRDRMINIKFDAGRIDLGGGEMLEPRVIFEFKTHAIFLPSIYDWVIGKDSQGARCLVPLKKKEKQNFNETHPEIKENEMFLTNCRSGTDDYTHIGWKTKRNGIQAFCVSGEALDGCYPVFVQKEEYEKGMKR